MVKKKSSKPLRKLDLGVLLEAMDKKFDLVLEGHDALGKELKDFRHEMRIDVGFLKFSQRVLGTELKDLTVKVDRNFDAIMKYLSRVDDEIQELKKIFEGRPDLKRVLALEQRVAQLELVVKKFYSKSQ